MSTWGPQLGGVESANAGVSSVVPVSGVSTILLQPNASRKGAIVFNDSSQILYLLLSNELASSISYTYQVLAGMTETVPYWYKGAVTAAVISGSGNARITEFV